jgi:Holliday junction resolvasome RuvABC endonuclease subunit
VRILGIDPGTAHCGFAVIELDGHVVDGRVLDLGCLRSDPEARLRDRIAEMATDLDDLRTTHGPGIVAVEAPAFPKGALAAAMVWSSYSVVVALCASRGIQLVTRNPGEWRRLLGLLAEKLPPAKTTDPKLRAQLSRQAQTKRKASTEALMRTRWPGAAALLESTPQPVREHAWDALAIATSWTDRATDTPKQAAQADLFNP